MVGSLTITIRGARELEDLLKALGPRIARKVGDRALRAAARPVLAEAKRLVHVQSGDLRRSLTVRTGRVTKESERAVYIGSAGFGWRAHFLEFGTSHSPAYPFLRPAMDTQARAAIDKMGQVLGDGIDKEAQALDKKAI